MLGNISYIMDSFSTFDQFEELKLKLNFSNGE